MYSKDIRYFIFLITLINFSLLNAQKNKKEKEEPKLVFDINAAISVEGKETGNYSIAMHHAGKTTDSNFVKNSNVFTLELNRNDVYTLSFYKTGFDTKYIMIDTHVPKGKAKQEYYELAFTVEMHPEHGMQKEEYKDHPVAIMKYYSKKDDFDYSTKYHEEISHKEKKNRGKK
ncbi:MAG: hypothetical protein ACK5D5_05390 [Bacteroidota bacterium]|jgi:hypothetical protein